MRKIASKLSRVLIFHEINKTQNAIKLIQTVRSSLSEFIICHLCTCF